MSECVENLADLAEKGLKKGDFTPKLLVFPTRFFWEISLMVKELCALCTKIAAPFFIFFSFGPSEERPEGASEWQVAKKRAAGCGEEGPVEC